MARDPTLPRREPISYTLAFFRVEYAAIQYAARAAGRSPRRWMIETLVRSAAVPADRVARALDGLVTPMPTPKE